MGTGLDSTIATAIDELYAVDPADLSDDDLD